MLADPAVLHRLEAVLLTLGHAASAVKAAVAGVPRAVAALAPDRLSRPVLAVLALSGCVAVCHFQSRRSATRAVRRALADPDPETRRAAVLVAAHHGLGRYGHALGRRVGREDAERVLLPLAEASRSQPHRGGRRRQGGQAHLRSWAEAFLAGRAAAGGREPAEAMAERRRPRDRGAGHSLQHLDALELMDALEAGPAPVPPQPVGGQPAPALGRHRWRARPDELDALTVVDALRPGPRRRAAAKAGAAGVDGTTDVDALLDELAGVGSRRPRAAAPRPRPHAGRRAVEPRSRAS